MTYDPKVLALVAELTKSDPRQPPRFDPDTWTDDAMPEWAPYVYPLALRLVDMEKRIRTAEAVADQATNDAADLRERILALEATPDVQVNNGGLSPDDVLKLSQAFKS